MKLHIKSPGTAPGVYPIVRRGVGLKYLSFTIIELAAGTEFEEYAFDTGEEEVSLHFYTGPVTVEAEGEYGRWTASTDERKSIRDAGQMIYIPRQSTVRLRTTAPSARVAIAGALGKPGAKPVLVGAEQAVEKTVGKDNWTRTVYTHIADNVDAAHLICGETVNHPGGWSSCPPHKHDEFKGSEVPMEEVYYFQVDPPQGFGFQRVYTQPDDPEAFDLAYAVENGDTVLLPRGYHPVASCPGYTLHYTWILAGEGRVYGAWADDPRHAWIKQ